MPWFQHLMQGLDRFCRNLTGEDYRTTHWSSSHLTMVLGSDPKSHNWKSHQINHSEKDGQPSTRVGFEHLVLFADLGELLKTLFAESH